MKIKFNLTKTLYWLVPVLAMSVYACSDTFLDQPAAGTLSDEQITSEKGANQLLIGAYAALKGGITGGDAWSASNTGWVFGSVAGGDAHKGSDAGDQSDINSIVTFTANPTNSYFRGKWITDYEGIGRCNATIKLVNKLTAEQISDASKKRIIGEARFLRGFYHFELVKMWGKVPYIDETVDYNLGNFYVSNTADILPKIIEDFQAAYNNLAESGLETGRANKWAAGAYLAKAHIFNKAYSIALPILTDVINKGMTPTGVKYGLNDTFYDNYNGLNDNNKESVFAYQASINDGSGAGNANPDLVLNFPYTNGPGGCCGFFQPSFDLVNSYRTTAGGLPLIDGSYNVGANQVKDDQGKAATEDVVLDTDPLDPRLDWTAGRKGIPYLDWGNHGGKSWIRDQSYGGPYSPKKNAFPKSIQDQVADGSSWTKGYTSLNYPLMRFADVLLLAAECEAEAGSIPMALDYVNRIRNRAANPDGFVVISTNKKQKTDWEAYLDKSAGRKPAANYVIKPYTIGDFSNKNEALKRIHFERKLELAMEGHRFFDLVRWGETTASNPIGNPVNLQAYLTYEGTRLKSYEGAKFTVGKNEVYPIPQGQIDLMNNGSKGGEPILIQNAGY